MNAEYWVLGLSIFVAVAGVIAAVRGARAGTPMPRDKTTWDGVSPFEVAFRKARKRDGFIAMGLAIAASLCGVAIALISR
jgi:hypothetical protein